MKTKYLILILALSIFGCEEKPSYDPIENTIPHGGIAIHYDPHSSLTNIQEIIDSLSNDDAEKFERSLSWYGTEALYGFQYIHGKTAKELVDIVNCLKITASDKQDECIK